MTNAWTDGYDNRQWPSSFVTVDIECLGIGTKLGMLVHAPRKRHISHLFLLKNVLPLATFAETLGAAFRRRGRLLCMHWRHEQLSIRTAVESALQHSVQRPHCPLIDVAVQTCTWIEVSSTDKSDENDILSSETDLSPTSTRPFATSTTPAFTLIFEIACAHYLPPILCPSCISLETALEFKAVSH